MLNSWQQGVLTIVKHCDYASDDVAFRDETKVTGVDGVLLVDSLQPVVIRFGAGLETRNKQRTVFVRMVSPGTAVQRAIQSPSTESQGTVKATISPFLTGWRNRRL
jgi:hypothetical protein